MLILNFESGSRFQDFWKNIHHFSLFSTPFSLKINFLLARLNVLEQQLDTDLKEKYNIDCLLEFYINNYLGRKKYKPILIHDITFCKYVLGMYLNIREAIFK